MRPEQLQLIREHMGLGRRDFARLLGYNGSDAQNWYAISRMERGVEKNGRPISPMCARLVLMIYREWLATGNFTDFDQLQKLAEISLHTAPICNIPNKFKELQMLVEPCPAKLLGRPVGKIALRYQRANQLLDKFLKQKNISLRTLKEPSFFSEHVANRREFAKLAHRAGVGTVILSYILERDRSTINNYLNPEICRKKHARYAEKRRERRARSANHDAGSGTGAEIGA